MNNKSLFKYILPSILVLITCHLAFQFLVKKCIWWECAPDRYFSLYDLNLPNAFFPSEAVLNPLAPDRNAADAIEEASTTNYWRNGSAIYIVLRFSTIQKSSEWYQKSIERYKFDYELENTQEYIDILSYKSKIADQNVVKCGYTLSRDLRCVFWGQYEEYYIFFSGSIGDTEITKENFIGILNFIDNKMVLFLK